MKKIYYGYQLVSVASCTVLILSLMLLYAGTSLSASWSPEKLLTDYLKKNYPWTEIHVTDIKAYDDLPHKAPVRIQVEKGPVGRGIFSFIFKGGKKVMVRARVTALGAVVKSKRPFRKGHLLKSEDIYLSKMDITRMPKSSVKYPENLIGKYLRRSITANIPIVEDMIEKSRAVKRGKRVMLVVRTDGLHIKALGKIIEKGYVGMPVKAVNLSSKKEVRGVLVNENTVEVEL